MSRTWLLQANPKLYDIDAALQVLDRIWWRTPQYTSDIRRGDAALIWRSGKDAGIVAVGTVTSEPRDQPMAEAESRFATGEYASESATTRTEVILKPTPFVSKDTIVSIQSMTMHPIVRAPMGTVFPVTSDQWDALRPLVQDPPPLPQDRSPSERELPAPFSWEQRSKSVHPMPGGYVDYLRSLSQLCDLIEEKRPTANELPDLMTREFGISFTFSELLASFLRKIGVLEEKGNAVSLGRWAELWRQSEDNVVIVALLHGRVRFVGEILSELRVPMSGSRLLELANSSYGMNWSTQAQVDRRRGWLQSAGMVSVTPEGDLQITDLGRQALTVLQGVQAPVDVRAPDQLAPSVVADPVEQAEPPDNNRMPLAEFIQELRESAIDAGAPDRFERVVRDAFAHLGFEAQWLGGAGKTDVLLDASLGKQQSYRVIVDCKTTASGSVTDHQIDWMTLREHKAKHDANYVAVVAPNPSGKRTMERATEMQVTLISVEQLIRLCEQHHVAPMGLDDYAKLFDSFGLADLEAVSEAAEEWLGRTALARSVVSMIRDRCERFGPLTARDVLLVLDDDGVSNDVSQEAISEVLNALANPLLGILGGTAEHGYTTRVSDETARSRLRALATRLAPASLSRELLEGVSSAW